MNNIEVFQDTLNRISGTPALSTAAAQAATATRLYNPGFRSALSPRHSKSGVAFEENPTLIPAMRLADTGKRVAVLNFANPVRPGGGVLLGAREQEEYLCRAGCLYPCLTSAGVQSYYRGHQIMLDALSVPGCFMATDRVIYSPQVTFFKEEVGYVPGAPCSPAQEYTDRWRVIDVITCAAPMFKNRYVPFPPEDLAQLFEGRIRNILETAIDNEAEALVLGAFGCGAFNNPPAIVARAFQTVLSEDRYRRAFSDVIFAVMGLGGYSENIETFKATFPPAP